jgi:hypothetical protein
MDHRLRTKELTSDLIKQIEAGIGNETGMESRLPAPTVARKVGRTGCKANSLIVRWESLNGRDE